MHFFKTSLLPFLLVSQIALGGRIILQEDSDEFDDDVSITLAFLEDSHSSFLQRMVMLQCDTKDVALAIENGLFFTLSDYLNVKVRFDKKETFEESFVHLDGLVGTFDKKYIQKFLDQALSSNDMVLRVEDNDHTMRFSDFSGDQAKIKEFLDKINSYEGCRLN